MLFLSKQSTAWKRKLSSAGTGTRQDVCEQTSHVREAAQDRLSDLQGSSQRSTPLYIIKTKWAAAELLSILLFCTVFQILAFSKFSVFLNYFVRFSDFSVQKNFQLSAFFFGGGEGSRTPVRKHFLGTFSGRRRFFTFPPPAVSRHTVGFSSFMMHGARKA